MSYRSESDEFRVERLAFSKTTLGIPILLALQDALLRENIFSMVPTAKDLDDINYLNNTRFKQPSASWDEFVDFLSWPHVILLVTREMHGNSIVSKQTMHLKPQDYGVLYTYIGQVATHKGYEGKGLGTLLSEKMEALARAISSIQIDLTSGKLEAHRLYLKLGFEKRDTTCFRKKLL